MTQTFLIKCGTGRFLERTELLELDSQLRIGNTVEVEIKPMPFHGILGLSKPQMIYRLLKVLGNSIEIVDTTERKIVFRKVKKCRQYVPLADAKILLGIVSGGHNLDTILANVSNAEAALSSVKVVINGEISAHSEIPLSDKVKLIDPNNYSQSGRFLISRKKNDIIKYAAKDFDYAIIMHDHYLLDKAFWQALLQINTNFDFLITQKRNLKYPNMTMHGEKERVSLPFDRISILPSLYPTKKTKSEFLHINGGVIIGSNHAFSKLKLDDCLGWSELEDVDFSTRAYFAGLVTKYEKSLCVFSNSTRLGPVKYEPIQVIKQYLKSLLFRIVK